MASSLGLLELGLSTLAQDEIKISMTHVSHVHLATYFHEISTEKRK